MTRHAAGRRWIAAVAAVLLVGCGNALAGSSVAGPAAGGPEARALALARRLVSELRLPAGAAPERLSKLPPGPVTTALNLRLQPLIEHRPPADGVPRVLQRWPPGAAGHLGMTTVVRSRGMAPGRAPVISAARPPAPG
jgi:hypothetical protein